MENISEGISWDKRELNTPKRYRSQCKESNEKNAASKRSKEASLVVCLNANFPIDEYTHSVWLFRSLFIYLLKKEEEKKILYGNKMNGWLQEKAMETKGTPQYIAAAVAVVCRLYEIKCVWLTLMCELQWDRERHSRKKVRQNTSHNELGERASESEMIS